MLKSSPRRIQRTAVRQSNREANAEIAWITAEERNLRDQITQLERFIVKAPEMAERASSAQHERLNTLPPPDEFLGDDGSPQGSGESSAPLRRTRAQIAAARRRRAFNLATFVAMAAAMAAFCLWIAENL